ncbi:MAG: alpha/beta hydrolase [Aeromicrobium erythreum]
MSTDDAPAWFTTALERTPERHRLEHAGLGTAYRAWGEQGRPVVVLVHGGAAHAGWWDHVGPFLADQRRVVAVDLAGHGDSDHASAYSLADWSDQVVAVAAAESGGSDVPPALVGHSMGGFVCLTAASRHGERLAGAVAIDSPVREMSAEARTWLASNPTLPPHKVHPDRETVLERFRTLPEDDATLPWLRRHIAAESVREVDGGWTWKFDPAIFLSARMEPEALAEAACRVALVRGERGMATRDITTTVAEVLGGHVPVTLVPDSGHHVMLDQPIALITALQSLLGEWSRP